MCSCLTFSSVSRITCTLGLPSWSEDLSSIDDEAINAASLDRIRAWTCQLRQGITEIRRRLLTCKKVQ